MSITDLYFKKLGQWDDEYPEWEEEQPEPIDEPSDTRRQKDKRILYHIGPTPAEPHPLKEEYQEFHPTAKGSGLFMTTNPVGIGGNHGRFGHVYAYKIPEWVIAECGGMQRYDEGSEIYITEDIWAQAGDEIEFLGKSMDEKEFANKIKAAEPQGWDGY